MVTRKIAPALAAGFTVVLKSPGETPFSANALAVLSQQAGVPKGVINIVTALDNTPQVGQTLCSSDVIRKISFTGSTRVGRLLMSQSSSTIKKLSLELGGNAPFIIFKDADLDLALREAPNAKFKSSGQTCVCANRIYVQTDIVENFTHRFVEAVKTFKLGSGHQDDTTHGPLISSSAVEKVAALVDNSLTQGAKVLIGGKTRPDLGPSYYEPTILTDVRTDMRITQEEIFGPVATIIPFVTENEVINNANACNVGLASYVFTENLNRARRVSGLLETGMVAINSGSVSDSAIPTRSKAAAGLASQQEDDQGNHRLG
ncbi:hypothetical protein LRP88_05648 [Fusarium phalaenopsidis]